MKNSKKKFYKILSKYHKKHGDNVWGELKIVNSKRSKQKRNKCGKLII